ncbi:hypothetical protein ES703_35719 [subsurface metagenome]
MSKTEVKRKRLSIDVLPEEQRMIKVYATLHGQSIREYVLETINARLHQEQENNDILAMTTQINPVLKELWDNDKDAIYDEI